MRRQRRHSTWIRRSTMSSTPSAQSGRRRVRRGRDPGLLLPAQLQVADALGARSVAFPAIATGVYGYPPDQAARIAVTTLRSAPTTVALIRLVAFDEQTHRLLRDALDQETTGTASADRCRRVPASNVSAVVVGANRRSTAPDPCPSWCAWNPRQRWLYHYHGSRRLTVVNVDDEAARRGGESFHPDLGGPGHRSSWKLVPSAARRVCHGDPGGVRDRGRRLRVHRATGADERGLPDPGPLRAARLRGDRILALLVAAGSSGRCRCEPPHHGVVDLERLAVAPPWRHRGYGALLLRHSYPLAAAGGGTRPGRDHRGHTVLSGWYERHGFTVTETRTFEHLPFTVCYLQRPLPPAEPPTTSTSTSTVTEPGVEP